mmetsp:Transcript_40050/g.68157  ORF Transcript_40050/g.68157 Transcript_40050/m.68157 type:complete len:506 (-) Transcript_40050:159-1676(-)
MAEARSARLSRASRPSGDMINPRASRASQDYGRMARNSNSFNTDSLLSFSNFGDGYHVLVTGGQGYIGAHTVLRLLEEGFKVTVIDSSVNSSNESLKRVRGLVSPAMAANLHSHELDLCDMVSLKATMMAISQSKKVDSCIHLAGLKAVGESVRMPLRYHQNNVTALLNLVEVLELHGCKQIVLSSTATVYGSQSASQSEEVSGSKAQVSGLTEESPVGVGIANPYGRAKFMEEQILEDMYGSPHGKEWGIVTLRYFNPVGAHPSGRLGEDPSAPPNNLMPYVAQVAMGKTDFLTIFGDDFDTPDGTGVRDYIHVLDVAEGHLAALKKLQATKGHFVYNLSRGSGISVMEMVDAMEQACGLKIRVKVRPRRSGDVPQVFANAAKAQRELGGWTAQLGIDRMCKDLWRWVNANPSGYQAATKEFGAFKPAFNKSQMPNLSSAARPAREKPKLPPVPPTKQEPVSTRMRGRGTSMDDILGYDRGGVGDDGDGSGHTGGGGAPSGESF